MGFFGKKNKSEDNVTTKSPDQIKGEQLNTELQSIRNEIQERKEQLEEKKDNIYSDIDKAIKDSQKTEE